MAEIHTVSQGEYLSSIAKAYGFSSYLTLWNAAQNADLKALRKNPNVLFPGDQVYIPDKDPKEISKASDARYTFQVKREQLKLRIRLEGYKYQPLAGHECLLSTAGAMVPLTTDGSGTIETLVPADLDTATLKDTGADGDIPRVDFTIPMQVGSLDPVTEITGQLARLNNLGYNAGPMPDHVLFPDEVQTLAADPQFKSAVEEFQCDFMGGDNLATIKSVVDGKCGPQTQAQLLKAHGC